MIENVTTALQVNTTTGNGQELEPRGTRNEHLKVSIFVALNRQNQSHWGSARTSSMTRHVFVLLPLMHANGRSN